MGRRQQGLPGMDVPPTVRKPTAREQAAAGLGDGWEVSTATSGPTRGRELMLDWGGGRVTFFALREGGGWTLTDFRGDRWCEGVQLDEVVAVLRDRVDGMA